MQNHHQLYSNPQARFHSLQSNSPGNAHKFHKEFFSATPTPLTSLPSIAKELGVAHVFLKNDSIRFGLPAFKILGASWAIFCVLSKRLGMDIDTIRIPSFKMQIGARDEKWTLYTATDGNHGRAVARVSSLLELKAKIYVPEAVSELSRDKIRNEGAEVIVVQADYDEAVRIAASKAETDDNGILIQDTAWSGYEEIPNLIVEGYTTLFSEITLQLREHEGLQPSLVVVPVGVGSLAHSAVQYYRSESSPHPPPSVLTVEPSTAACLNTSLHAGQSTPIQTGETVMPGLNCGTVSYTAWPDLYAGVDCSVVVSDREASTAMDDLKDLGVLAGPCGAAPLAGLRAMAQSQALDPSSVVVLICTEGRE